MAPVIERPVAPESVAVGPPVPTKMLTLLAPTVITETGFVTAAAPGAPESVAVAVAPLRKAMLPLTETYWSIVRVVVAVTSAIFSE